MRGELGRERIDALVVASPANFQYLTGYRSPSWPNRARPLVLVVDRAGRHVAVLSEAEAERARTDGVELETAPYLEPVRSSTSDGAAEFIAAAVDTCAPLVRGARRLGLELGSQFGPTLPSAALAQLTRAAGAEPVDAAPLLWHLRMRKSPYEVKRLRRAAEALDRAYQRFRTLAEAGMTERELHRQFLRSAAESGADWIGYVNVVVGASAPLVGGARERRWAPGELLLVDAGLLVEGYWSDFWRIFANEAPSEQQLAAYARIVDAVRGERNAIRAGALPGEVAHTVTGYLGVGPEGGFGRVGHGIGLELTEPPSLHGSDETALAAGMVLCIEPTAAFSGVGNFVAEETVLVTQDGCELLSPPFPTSLEQVG